MLPGPTPSATGASARGLARTARSRRPAAGPRRRAHPLRGRALRRLALLVGCLAALLAAPPGLGAVELCSAEGQALMRSVGIGESQIAAVCEKAARASAPLTLSVQRTQDELGYCRVTLALTNNTTLHLNALVLTVEQARYDGFHFRNVLPGGTGYASANSRNLLACDELVPAPLTFHWPVSLRIGDRTPVGRQLLHYRPYLLDPRLAWDQPESGRDP